MIAGSCTIRNNTIRKDGKEMFERRGLPLKDFFEEAYQFLQIDYPKFYKMDSLSKAGFLASEVLLKDRSLVEKYGSEYISLVLSNKAGSLDADKKYFESMKTMASPALFVYTLPNIVAGEITIRHKIKGEGAFFVSPSFDAELMSFYVSSVLSPGPEKKPRACIGGWVDVLDEHHDVFLYLQETNRTALLDSAEQVHSLYTRDLWNN